MNWICTAAVGLAAASMVALGGCAADQPNVAKAQEANPCIGVPPPTGSLVRRKEDCGARSQDEQAKQDMIDAIRSRGGLGGSVVKPGG